MYSDFTFEEMTLMSIYMDDTREGTIRALLEMYSYLEPDETELLALTNSVISKLEKLSDADFEALDLFPEFLEKGEENAV